MFELLDDRLDITMTIKTAGKKPFPFGTGHHTYFVRTPQTILRASLPKVWMSENMVPVELVTALTSGTLKMVGRSIPIILKPNMAVMGLPISTIASAEWDQHAEITWPEFQNTTLKITADPAFRHFVILFLQKKPFSVPNP